MKHYILIFIFLLTSAISVNLKGQNYPPIFDKKTIKGGKGITIPKPDVDARSGYGTDLQFIGDINNDGLEDIAISSGMTTVDGMDYVGKVYIIFGSTDEFDFPFDLSTLNGSNGFVLEGVEEDERRGRSVAGPGDINGDGIDDLIIGGSVNNGVKILYGKSSFSSLIKSSEINGSNGFSIDISKSGSVSKLGDVNGDGINDFIIGTPDYFNGFSACIIFGRSDNFPTEIDESYFDGVKGFRTTHFPASNAGYKVGGAGDINNDGINDVMIGSWNGSSVERSISYVLFGQNGTFDSLVEIEDVDGSDGFQIDNRDNNFLTFVGHIGDVNGDGIDDCFSENNIIFGSDDPFPAEMLMADFNGDNGFIVKNSLLCVASAGDLNFDGIDDFLIAVPNVNIVYGTSGGFPSEFDRADIDGTNGFLIDDLDHSNVGRPIDGGKDFNGDGLDDFIFGEWTYESESVYIVFGGDHYAIPFHDDYPKIEDITTEGFSLNVKAQEKGKVYFAVFESSSYYTVNYEAINSGLDAIMHGEFTISTANTEVIKLIEGLQSSTKYDVHLYFEDEAENIGEIYSFEEVKTLFDPATAFVTTWDTENEGDTNDDQIRFIVSRGTCDIHWENLADPSINGVVEDETGTTTITFPEPGKYKVALSNTIGRFYFTRSTNSDSRKLLTVEQWGTNQWTSMKDMFLRCFNMTMPATDLPDLTYVTNMQFMFAGASEFNTSINNWDVSNVTDFNSLFSGASSFNQNLNNWDVSNVTTMSNTFYGTSSFNSDITNWDVSNVTDMYGMFNGASVFNQDIRDWDVSNVSRMGAMFKDTQFNQDIGDWDVGNVTTMTQMFWRASAFNQDISNWDVSKVTDMSYMFSETFSFNQDIGEWNVSNVENMSRAFRSSSAFDQDLGDWDISKVENISWFLWDSSLSPCNYSTTLEGWSKLNLNDGLTFHAGSSKFISEAEVFRQSIIDDFNWTINDYGELTNEVTISIDQEVSCPGASDAILEGSSSISDVDFKWYNEEDELIGEDALLENIGVGTYTLKVEATADCFFTKEITISDGDDDESPEITCPEDQLLTLGSNLPDYTSWATVSDNCDSDVSVSQSPARGTEFTEETTITLTAEDENGNTETCTFTVEVSTDNEAPEIDCPTDQSLACDITEIPDYTNLVSASDNSDPDPAISQSPAVGSTFIDGMTITMTAADAAGNTSNCTFIVNLEEDTEAPSITCPAEQSLFPGENLPDYTGMAVVSDNCDSDPEITQSPEIGTEFTTDITITLTATDASGNAETCTFEVTAIPDTEAPEITCPEDQTLACDATEVPDFTNLVTATDDRDDDPALTQSPAPGTAFTDGMTITMTAEDAAGNTSSCTLTVNREEDTEAPTITCPSEQSLIPGESLPDYTSLAVATDNCDSDPDVTQSPAIGTEFTSDVTITLTATDANGNTQTCTFEVTDNPDTEAPEISCLPDQEIACDINQVPDFTSQVTVTDNRDGNPEITQSPVPGTTVENDLDIIITATDAAGNTSECSFLLEIDEGDAPTFTCLPDQALEPSENCEITVPDFTELVEAESACATISSITQSPEAGTQIFKNTVATITVEDSNGQQSTCEFHLNIPEDYALTVDAGPDAKISVGDSHQLDAFASTEGIFSWSPSQGLNNPEIANPVASPQETTTYKVTFTSVAGCTAEDEVIVEVEKIIVPKGFSPDYDGVNETWELSGIENYPDNEVILHNRWGNIVFALKNYNNTSRVFDGNANRNTKMGAGELPEGTYYYSIQLSSEEKPMQGFIVLKR